MARTERRGRRQLADRRPRPRVRQSHRTRPGHRRAGSRVSAASTSSSDDGPPGEGPATPDLIWGTACPQCAAPLHTDREGAQHCGVCAVSWWEGVR
jgi:hypothetical protein